MLYYIFFLLQFECFFSQEFKTAPPPGLRTTGEVWPLPQQISYGKKSRSIGKDSIAILYSASKPCEIIETVRNIYLEKWLFPQKVDQNYNNDALTLKLNVHKPCIDADEYPQEDMIEEYWLTVPETGDAVLDAREVWGIIRGLETFSQLIFRANDTYKIRTAKIHDWPRFSVRGVLLDTSRHFISPNTIKRQIDLMAQNKMNVFHWHIVDIESFPYTSIKFPQLTIQGAFTPKHVYTRKTIAEIIDYARIRGVRVMAEFDTPGHTGSWKGQPGFLAKCFDEKGDPFPQNIIDPTKDENFQFLKDLFVETTVTFPEKFVHLGGDEVDYWTQACWLRNPDVLKFMGQRGFGKNLTLLENYYFERLQKIINFIVSGKNGSRMVFWQEVFDNNNPVHDAVVHVWKGNTKTEWGEELVKVTAKGHQAILSSCWYLNYINYGPDWKEGPQYYYCDPQSFNGTEEQKQLVIGGIAAMWGEFVDATNVEARLWPRASAVAERLWSAPENTTNADKAWPRLHEHRCRMLSRGYRAEPVNGPSFCLDEWELP